jgi:hypothetical protein
MLPDTEAVLWVIHQYQQHSVSQQHSSPSISNSSNSVTSLSVISGSLWTAALVRISRMVSERGFSFEITSHTGPNISASLHLVRIGDITHPFFLFGKNLTSTIILPAESWIGQDAAK